MYCIYIAPAAASCGVLEAVYGGQRAAAACSIRFEEWARVDCTGLFDAAVAGRREKKRGYGVAVEMRWWDDVCDM